jgi:major type 1 subunit fimbrin (pilin)
MNLKAIASALLVAGLAAPSAFASTGTILFTGTITNITCKVDGEGSGGPDFTVPLGPVNISDFPNEGDVSGRRGFKIVIGGDATCPNDTLVWATFDPGATVDPNTGALKTVRANSGVQIRLFNENAAPINIWGDQGVIKKEIVDNTATLAYFAGYERKGTPTVGEANSSVLYTVRYEPKP